MSALFGAVSPDAEQREPAFAHMSALLEHRGARLERRNVADLSAGLRVPVHGATGGAADRIVTSGKSILAISGSIFSPGDEVDAFLRDLLRRFESSVNRARLSAALLALNGFFALMFYDGRSGALRLVRDAAGERSLYFGHSGRSFYFAVEPYAVLSVPGFPRRLRPAAVAEYLSFSFVPGLRTMLEDLYELPAGHYAEFDTRAPEKAPVVFRYFEPELLEQPPRESAEESVSAFRRTLEQCVADRRPASGRTGVFLSGGLDSTIVAGIVQKQSSAPVPAYSLHFGKKYANELDYARAAAQAIGCEHREIEIRPRSFLSRLVKMVRHLGEPIGDPVTVGNFELARQISGDVDFVYNGEGGDPCFGGPKNLVMMMQHWYGGVERDARFRARKYLASYQRCYAELHHIFAPEFRARWSDAELEDVLLPFFETERPSTFLKKLLSINMRLKGAHLILPKVERMTGAWALRPLAPLFDRRMVEASHTLPPELILHRSVEKIILKRAFADDVPLEIIERPKSGMRVPVFFWFQGELKRYARKILSRKEIRRAGIFDAERVQQLLRYDIEEGAGRYGIRLWMLLTFEIWRRLVLEGEDL